MPAAIIDEDPVTEMKKSGDPPPPQGGSGDGGREGGGRNDDADPQARGLYLTGIYLALATITMFFMALASAYIVRKGVGSDWLSLAPPRILWLNTAVLIASSVTLEVARRKLAANDSAGFRAWWGFTTALGLLFLAGQIVAWRQLAEAGIFLATNASSAFFYLLTAAHGIHLLFGVAALGYVAFRNWREQAGRRLTRAIAAEVTGVYWHFMDGLWVFLLLLLSFGR
ncbi:MAG TPA: heme-copper oxidase subunit III [Terriglobia bacterium]